VVPSTWNASPLKDGNPSAYEFAERTPIADENKPLKFCAPFTHLIHAWPVRHLYDEDGKHVSKVNVM
jgi:Ni,Fe-hydrogenase I large subunit